MKLSPSAPAFCFWLSCPLATTLPIPYQPETNLDSIRESWIQACMEFNESAAEQTLNQAFSMFPVEAPGRKAHGNARRAWERGEQRAMPD
ncbi:MAG: hypothetical protein LUQ15_00225 [Methanothrix sp.]|nr:hypothetical protein [Methanothrix sp.]OYV10466.1 MAG: hypothetical protein CG437_255 [Methanosaeta sp. NSP1]